MCARKFHRQCIFDSCPIQKPRKINMLFKGKNFKKFFCSKMPFTDEEKKVENLERDCKS